MEFHPRVHPFSGNELAELVAISPDDAAMQQGFHLQDPEVDDVIRTAKDLEAGYIDPDTSLTAEENVELLLRTTRLLQLGLEVQNAEAQTVLAENNTLRGDLRELEDQNRNLEGEIAELRELRDQEGFFGDAKELELELKELRQTLDEERKANSQLIDQTDHDRATIDDLEGRLQRSGDVIKRKDDELLDQREQLTRLRDDFDELRGQYAALTAQGHGREQQRELSETIRQQEWKIERLTKDNRALEASNCELRVQLEALKEENLQVSEKILLLDAEAKELRLAAAAADDRAEVLAREKVQVMGLAEELRADVAAKMALLDEFEARFARQYRSWDEERSSLVSQIEALRKEARLYAATGNKATGAGGLAGDGSGGGGSGSGGADGKGGEGSPQAQLAALKKALDEAKENEVLLLEAYEQLEADVGQEVDRALGRQAEEMARLSRRVQFLEGHLETEKKQVEVLGEEVSRLEGNLGDATARMAQYESGVYGLPQAALEIRQLKDTVAAGENRVRELVQQVNKLSAALEDLSDEAVLLRRKAGLPPNEPLDTAGVKLQKDITIAQLRSVNSLLERQVSDLEEERRKLRLEVKFRAKYHGKTALEMGLSPEQLLLLEEYVEGLKGGRNPEERLVTQLQQRIEFLEVRLAEVMAYADIPINMRPALTELSSGSMSALAAVGTAGQHGSHAANLQHLFSGLSSQTDGSDSSRGAAAASATAGVVGGIKATQVELVRGALLGCLKMLRQMSEALAEHRQISDTEYKQFTDTIIDKLIDAERVTSMLLKDLAASAAAASNSATMGAITAATTPTADEQQAHGSRRYGRAHAVLDENFVADAAAEELRERLQQLAKQVVELQVSLAQKDALLAQLAQHKAAMEARLGLSGGPDGDAAGVAAAAVAARRGGDYVPREQHEQLEIEVATIKEQLIECLEELNSRELELTEMSSACRRYQSDMAELSDQVRLLYREHSNSTASWQQKCNAAEKQLKKAQAEAADATTQLSAVEQALKTLEAGDMDSIKHQYVDAVRKMAVAQLKHAKLARQLESASTAEKAASERVEELQEELQDCSSTCRSRIRWLEQAAADAARRTQQLYRCLQNAAPLEAYQALVAKHSQLAQEHRKLLEQWGDAAVSDGTEEVLAVRQQLADLISRYDAACDTVAELREKLRQLELPSTLASKSNPAFSTPSSRPQLAAAVSSQAVTVAGGSALVHAGEVQLQLNQDLVGATVKLDSANRRMEVLEREKDRLNKSLEDAQLLANDLEQRLASVSAELSTSRALEGRLQQRLAGSVPAAQLEQMAERLQLAEAAAAQEESRMTALTLRAEEAERKLAELGSKRQRQLADITNLKATVRELSSTSDTAAQFGKLADELNHVRAKEGLARSALNRSEMERVELERQTRSLKQQVASLTVQLSLAQDQARWAESELLDTLMRLEIGLAGRVEAWKATRWAAKLEQLKCKNDSLAQALESAVKRFSKLEDAAHEAQLATDIHADIAALLSRGASEAHREMTALKQQQMNLKLEAGRLTRAELLMRQKVGYLESVNAELCEQLERCDAEAFSHQGGLQAEKAELAARMRQLQEEVVRLQERSSNYLAELEELKTARSSKSLLAPDGDSQPAAAPGAVVPAKSAVADKELMLKQIDSLKEARTEAEHMRLEVRRLESSLDRKEVQLMELQAAYDDVLERLKGQSNELLAALGGAPGSVTLGCADETALSQLRSIAEAAMRELQFKVKEREEQLAELANKLQEHQAAYLEQHARDRAEIEALSNKLFESGAASIAGLKANLAKASAALAATGDGGEELPYEQLRLLLEQRSSEVEVLRNRLDQREASLEALKRNYDTQARHQEAEIQRLTASLSAAPKEDVNRPGSKMALQRLASEVKAKDVKLKQLRGAIKALEEKLAQLLKDKVDIVLQASSWVEQEQLDERLTEMEAQKAQLAADLQATQAELGASRKSLAMQESMMRKMSEQLLKEGEAVIALKAELAREQAAAKTLRDKLAKAVSSSGGSSSTTAHEEQLQLQQQVSSLSKRIATLETENQHLQAEVSRLTAFSAALQTSAAAAAAAQQAAGKADPQHTSQTGAAAARRAGVPLAVKPHRLASTLKTAESVGMPGTPTDAAAGPGGAATGGSGRQGRGAAAGRGFSSDGGASVIGTGTPGGTLTGGSPNRFAQAAGSSGGGARESDGGQGTGDGAGQQAGAAGGVTYAPQQWEEVKTLQGKVDALRRKLVKKGEECDNLLKECDRRNTLIAGLTADRDKAAAAAAAAQAKLRKQGQDAAAGPPIPAVDASKLKDYVEQVLQLQAEKDELMLQLELLKQQQPAGAAGAPADQQQLLQLRLQKEQAVAAAVRLKQQLAELFQAAGVVGDGMQVAAASTSSGGAGEEAGNRPASAAGGSSGLRRSSAGGSKAAVTVGRVSGREAELLATVANLKAALEKAMACSTPNTRHMQEVQQRKAAQKEADKLRTEVDRLKPQLSAANSKVAELQAANAALRVSVSELKQWLLLAADGIPVEPLSTGRQASGAGRGPGQDEVAALQQHLSQSEAQATQLRQQLSVMERQLAHRSSSSAGDGQQDAQAAQQLVSLQQQVSALQQENQELRHELGAFDPAFFEELEDLKHSHHQLQQKATAQAKLIRQLQHQLTHAGSNSQRVSSSGIGPEGSSGSGVGGRSTRLAP